MDLEMIDEMQRMLDLACARPDAPEGRSALQRVAELWRRFVADLEKGIAFSATIPISDRQALVALMGAHLDRLEAELAAECR